MNRRGMIQAAVAVVVSIPLIGVSAIAGPAPSLARLKTKAEQIKDLLETTLRLKEAEYPDVRFWVEDFNGGLVVAARSAKLVAGRWCELGYALTESAINDGTYLATIQKMTPRLVTALSNAVAIGISGHHSEITYSGNVPKGSAA